MGEYYDGYPHIPDDGGTAAVATAPVRVCTELDGEQLEEAWELYYQAFEPLNALAVQRHLMHRYEFDPVMQDPRVDKYLYYTPAGQLAGLATYTNDLNAVPLISPAYFQRRWPDLYEQRRIWYIGFVCAAAHGGFVALVDALHRVVAATGGVVGLDVCAFNEHTRSLPKRIEQILLHIRAADVHQSTVGVHRADEQSYWLYEFPPSPPALVEP